MRCSGMKNGHTTKILIASMSAHKRYCTWCPDWSVIWPANDVHYFHICIMMVLRTVRFGSVRYGTVYNRNINFLLLGLSSDNQIECVCVCVYYNEDLQPLDHMNGLKLRCYNTPFDLFVYTYSLKISASALATTVTTKIDPKNKSTTAALFDVLQLSSLVQQ